MLPCAGEPALAQPCEHVATGMDEPVDPGADADAMLVYAMAEISLKDKYQVVKASECPSSKLVPQSAQEEGPHGHNCSTNDAAEVQSSASGGAVEAVEAAADRVEGVRGVAKSLQICFDFTKGMCTRGDKCKYTHDLATIVQFNSKEKGICFDYLRNQCQRGLLCRFSHDLSNIAQQCQVFNGTATKGRTNAICYDFVKGVCQRGSECRYSHDLSLIARTARGGVSHVRSGEVCYDYLRGRCTRGSSCKYSHSMAFLNGGGAEYMGMMGGCGSAEYMGYEASGGSGHSSMGGAQPQGVLGGMGAPGRPTGSDSHSHRGSGELSDTLCGGSDQLPGGGIWTHGAPHAYLSAPTQQQHAAPHLHQHQQPYVSLAGYGPYAASLQHVAAASLAQAHLAGAGSMEHHQAVLAQQLAAHAAMAEQQHGGSCHGGGMYHVGGGHSHGGAPPHALGRVHSGPVGSGAFLVAAQPPPPPSQSSGGHISSAGGSGNLLLSESFNAILANLGGHKDPVVLADALKGYASIGGVCGGVSAQGVGSSSISGALSGSLRQPSLSVNSVGGAATSCAAGGSTTTVSSGLSSSSGGGTCGRPPVVPPTSCASGGNGSQPQLHSRLSEGSVLDAPVHRPRTAQSAPQSIPSAAAHRTGSEGGACRDSSKKDGDASSLPEAFSLPRSVATLRGSTGGGAHPPAADAAALSRTAPAGPPPHMGGLNAANLPPDLMPLLKQIWNKP